jgi:hypothetical protein
MKMNFQRVLNKNEIYIKSRKTFFRQEETKYLMVSLSATDPNLKKKWKGFSTHYQSLN